MSEAKSQPRVDFKYRSSPVANIKLDYDQYRANERVAGAEQHARDTLCTKKALTFSFCGGIHRTGATF